VDIDLDCPGCKTRIAQFFTLASDSLSCDSKIRLPRATKSRIKFLREYACQEEEEEEEDMEVPLHQPEQVEEIHQPEQVEDMEVPHPQEDWIVVEYENSRNFDREKEKIFMFKFGVVYFACTSHTSATRLRTALMKLFVEPTAKDPSPFRCIKVGCSHTFQTALDSLLHMESKCSFIPGDEVNLRASPTHYPAHFVPDVAVECLANTKRFDGGPLDLIDVENLPFRFGHPKIRHLMATTRESHQERTFIAPGKRVKRTLLTYAAKKWDWLQKEEINGPAPRALCSRKWPSCLWFLSFIKTPTKWPDGTLSLIENHPCLTVKRR
jgi:hypothetical protein